MKIIESNTHNPIENLAFEEALFTELDSDELVLFLYTNTDCIVMGRHQNPWCECPNILTQPNIPLLRRFTGGGTVFHDLGNLNIGLMGKNINCDQILTDLICTPLKQLGLDIKYVKSYGDLLTQGSKISGRAHYVKKSKAIHHATLLINTKLDKLQNLLHRPYCQDIETHAISSRIAKSVVNLSTLSPGLTIPLLKKHIFKFVHTKHSISKQTTTSSFTFKYSKSLLEAQKKHCDPKWIYGNTPKFIYKLPILNQVESKHQPRVNVKHGCIIDFIDLPKSFEERISKQFLGTRFDPQKLTYTYHLAQIYHQNIYKSQLAKTEALNEST